MSHKNPPTLCTWGEESACVDCRLKGKLNCRLNPRDFTFFMLNQVPSLVMALFGLVLMGLLVGAWWPLIVYGVGCIVLWGLGLETRILCSHCPYWAEDSKTLHCWALTGSPKVWRYRPGPMNKLEKATLVLFFSFVVLFPVFIEAYGIWFMSTDYAGFGLYGLLGIIGITVATLMAGLQFLYVLRYYFCSRCVNFSCPLNGVPKSVVDQYLARNPVMRDAWQRSGYKLGE